MFNRVFKHKVTFSRRILDVASLAGLYTAMAMTPLGSGMAEAAGFAGCANENGTCSVPSGDLNKLTTIRYGVKNSSDFGGQNGFKYTFVYGISGVQCSNGIFGDPAKGIDKSCARTSHNPLGIDTSGYSGSCGEGSNCIVSSSGDVYVLRYGASGRYVYQFAKPGQKFRCDNGFFKFDPYPGQTKTCNAKAYQIGDTAIAQESAYSTDSTGYQYGVYNDCANEGQNCNINSNLPTLVTYGSGDNVVTHVYQTQQLQCNNNGFGYDPSNGNTKFCNYRKLPPSLPDSSANLGGRWELILGQPPYNGKRTYNEKISYGTTTGLTEVNTREFNTSIGFSFTKNFGLVPNVGFSGSATISVTQDFTRSNSIEESFSQDTGLEISTGCESNYGDGLYVWQFVLEGAAEHCLQGTGNSCLFETRFKGFVCTNTNEPPSCTVGLGGCGI
ncbi:hypothetical protein [Alteromonas sp. a30]|uniref:hypothetical protein n=1 Tax=Alteromonas sp. a30 TaxID=2730917 RepID=UPI00227E53AB|nr:hypothetical protein [Alteromonas sp. a30]MCY7295820.1 hypothetical protein [Alteromonas sp. a30]